MDENTSTGPTAWSLGGTPPEPQRVTLPKQPTTPDEIAAAAAKAEKVNTAATHTGTDPLGRAIGPREDHRDIKKVRDPETGKVVTPKADGTLPKAKR